ncbi:MAG: hypothetical protein KBC33_04095 [Candidatus Pacebacteria bacterium]|nr:hypothetical protein [Candidatus Paceibacterota bacterium]
MKKVFVILLFVTIYSHSAHATTIRYSPARLIVNSQLVTSAMFSLFYPTFGVSWTPVETPSGSISGMSTVQDVVYYNYTSAGVVTTCAIAAPLGSLYTSVNPSIGTVDQGGTTAYVSDGTAQFNVRYRNLTKAVKCPFSDSGVSSAAFSGMYASSSLAAHILDTMDDRLTGITPSNTTQRIYSSYNDTTHTYTRNTNLFIADVDLTSIPATRGTVGPSTGDGFLVAPDIMVQAKHVAHANGTVYWFVDDSNNAVSTTQVGRTDISGTDMTVIRVSPAVTGVSFAKILPSYINTKITSTALNYANVPMVYQRQDRSLYIGAFKWHQSYDGYDMTRAYDDSSPFYDWFSDIIGGDSGNPAFLVINDELVALGSWSNSSNGWSLNENKATIEAAMTGLGSAYSLTEANLSAFPTF